MNTVDPRLSGPGLYYPAPRLHTGADTGGGGGGGGANQCMWWI